MTTATLTLSDFLLARYAELEDAAQAANYGHWEARRVTGPWIGTDEAEVVAPSDVPDRGFYRLGMHRLDGPVARHVERHDPVAVLADIEVKRQIVEMHTVVHSWMDSPTSPPRNVCSQCEGLETYPCRHLMLLASVYADHPDFRPEWAL